MAERRIKPIREPKPPKGFHWEYVRKGEVGKGRGHAGDRLLWVRDGYHLVACTGEAHSNAFIDNCGMCAPQWGYYAKPDNEPEQSE